MRSLLLHVHDEPAFDARLQVALDLARAFKSHLTLLHTIPFTMVMPIDPYGMTAAELSPSAKVAADEFRIRIEARLTGEDVAWDWAAEFGLASSQILEHAALSDLAILGAGNSDDSKSASKLAGMLAMQCRTPILVVPDKARGIDPGGAAVVCWNGSQEASRALRAAVPLLQAASAVTLIQVAETDEQEEGLLPPTAAARFLNRHDIDCEIAEIARDGRNVGALLRDEAQAREAHFMVMGAYGVPRLFETLFGGVTRTVLTDPQVPVLLAH
ncbi:universal stress protein [Aurantiacibacter atlanticus]|uniref:universal stress protein n=1 Tax=Aurantiacibacter atlanticus TaxID=1648404 RepID=UPI00065F64EA|nr:universal stress protein [Aurantiacibacter atlanticus]